MTLVRLVGEVGAGLGVRGVVGSGGGSALRRSRYCSLRRGDVVLLGRQGAAMSGLGEREGFAPRDLSLSFI